MTEKSQQEGKKRQQETLPPPPLLLSLLKAKSMLALNANIQRSSPMNMPAACTRHPIGRARELDGQVRCFAPEEWVRAGQTILE